MQKLETSTKEESKLDLSSELSKDLSEQELSQIVAQLQQDPMITSLNLSKLNLGPEGIIQISQAFTNITRLQVLTLNQIGSDKSKKISQSQWNVQSIPFGTDGINGLITMLEQNPDLRSLSLNNNKLGDESPSDLKRLIQAISKRSKLQTLHLNLNDLGSQGALWLSEILPYLPDLEELDLFFNNLGDDGINVGIKLICSKLRYTAKLKSIRLGRNQIHDEGMKCLAQVLPLLPCLEKLELYHNWASDDGMQAIFKALLQMKGLKSLTIGNDGNKRLRLSFKSVFMLCEVLNRHPELETLNIDGIETDDHHSLQVFRALKELSKLTSLSLAGSHFGVNATPALVQLLSMLNRLKHLFMPNCGLGSIVSELPGSLLPLIWLRTLNINNNIFKLMFFIPTGEIANIDKPIEKLLKRNEAIHEKISSVLQKLAHFEAMQDSNQEDFNTIQTIIDEIYEMAEQYSTEYGVELTQLYDVYYHMICRLMLIVKDTDAAQTAAASMSQFPYELFLPIAPNEPAILGKVLQALTSNHNNSENMIRLIELLLRTDLKTHGITTEEKFTIMLSIASHVDPIGQHPFVPRYLNMMQQSLVAERVTASSTVPTISNLDDYHLISFSHLVICAKYICVTENTHLELSKLLDQTKRYSANIEQQLLQHPAIQEHLAVYSNRRFTTYENVLCENGTNPHGIEIEMQRLQQLAEPLIIPPQEQRAHYS